MFKQGFTFSEMSTGNGVVNPGHSRAKRTLPVANTVGSMTTETSRGSSRQSSSGGGHQRTNQDADKMSTEAKHQKAGKARKASKRVNGIYRSVSPKDVAPEGGLREVPACGGGPGGKVAPVQPSKELMDLLNLGEEGWLRKMTPSLVASPVKTRTASRKKIVMLT